MRVYLIDKQKFAKAALDKNSEIFVVYVVVLEALKLAIHPFWALLLATLQQDKASTKIPLKYVDYADVFSPNLAMELPENTSINEHVIKLIEGKQPPHGRIYSVGPLELETLKAYIETYLKTGFIWPSNSSAGVPIFFDKKPDGSLRLYVDYRGLNNLIIKNWYHLPLIGKSLDRLGHVKRFTQLDFTSTYYRMRILEDDE